MTGRHYSPFFGLRWLPDHIDRARGQLCGLRVIGNLGLRIARHLGLRVAGHLGEGGWIWRVVMRDDQRIGVAETWSWVNNTVVPERFIISIHLR